MDRPAGLTRDKWLDEALQALAELGHEALRADTLAKRLAVSRGSFYWHFSDVPSFQRAVLDRWEQSAVDRPLERIAREGSDRAAELDRLIGIAFTGAPTLERAVRGWAAVHALAAEAVATVDRRRIRELTAMFEQGDVSPPRAEASAIVLYWAYVGRVVSGDPATAGSTLAEVRARLGSVRATGPSGKRGSTKENQV